MLRFDGVTRTIVVAMPLVLALGARGGLADPVVYYHAAAWHAYTDKDADGKDVCGIATTNPVDGRDFAMTYLIGGDNLDFRATKPSWNIPDNTQLNVSMQIDGNQPWPADGIGHGNSVDWAVGAASIREFDALFRAGHTLTVSFPSGNEPPWTLSLAGSTAVSQTLWRCVQDLGVRDHVVTPATNTPGPASAAPTEPYAPPAAASSASAPAAPTQPNAPPPSTSAPTTPAPAAPAPPNGGTPPATNP